MKEQNTRSRFFQTTRIWSTSQPQKCLTADRRAGHKNSPASIFESTIGQARKTENRTHYQGVQSTAPKRGGVENQPITTVLGRKHFGNAGNHTDTKAPWRDAIFFVCSSARLSSLPARRWSPAFLEEIGKLAKEDPQYQEAKEAALEEPTLKEIKIQGNLLYRKEKLWIPAAAVQRAMESEHDTRAAGHMGQDKTIELIRRNFWWPKMNERIIDFVRSCLECQRNKAARHQPYGLSSPLELPYAPWQSVAMCDTGTSGQRRSDGNIELVRFLDSHEGDGARAVFASIQLLYKNNFPNDPPSKFAHR